MDTGTPKQPPVMRPMHTGEASSHVRHRPAHLPTQAKAYGLRYGGVGSPKVL